MKVQKVLASQKNFGQADGIGKRMRIIYTQFICSCFGQNLKNFNLNTIFETRNYHYSIFFAGSVNTSEILNGPEGCTMPDLPKGVYDHNMIMTANNDILTCGGSFLDKKCYRYDKKSRTWNPHSDLKQGRAEHCQKFSTRARSSSSVVWEICSFGHFIGLRVG